MDAQCIYLMNQCSFFQICGGWCFVEVGCGPGFKIPSKVRVGCPKDKVRVGPWSNITKLSKVRVGCMRKIQELAKLELTIRPDFTELT